MHINYFNTRMTECVLSLQDMHVLLRTAHKVFMQQQPSEYEHFLHSVRSRLEYKVTEGVVTAQLVDAVGVRVCNADTDSVASECCAGDTSAHNDPSQEHTQVVKTKRVKAKPAKTRVASTPPSGVTDTVERTSPVAAQSEPVRRTMDRNAWAAMEAAAMRCADVLDAARAQELRDALPRFVETTKKRPTKRRVDVPGVPGVQQRDRVIFSDKDAPRGTFAVPVGYVFCDGTHVIF